MKRIMLLAAVHALIINQVQKNSRGKIFSADQKKGQSEQSIAGKDLKDYKYTGADASTKNGTVAAVFYNPYGPRFNYRSLEQ